MSERGFTSFHCESPKEYVNMVKQFKDSFSVPRIKSRRPDLSDRVQQQEANVENGTVSTRGTHKVLREEIINGQKFLVLSI